MASYFILGLIEIFMLCFNEIKLKGGGLRGCRSGLKGAAHIWWVFLLFSRGGAKTVKLSLRQTSRACCGDRGGSRN